MVAAALACACVAPAGALGAIGDLTFNGCVGSDEGCTPTNPATALNGADSVAMSADGTSVYVTANSGSTGGVHTGLIDEFSRNTSTGALTFQGCLGDGAGSSCTETNPTNALGQPESVAVSADGNSVYVGAFFAGAVDVFSRNTATGVLTFAGCIGNEAGCTPTSSKGLLNGVESVGLSADGTSVYVGSENSIDVFARNTSTGALTYKSCVGEHEGCTATTPKDAVLRIRSVAVSPDGSSVYGANFAFGVVDVFARNTATGALTYESCIGKAGSECPTTVPNGALDGAQSLAVSADGTSLYAASFGDPGPGGVVAFSRNTATGALTYNACFGGELGCTATTPEDALGQSFGVTASPGGESAYAAAEVSNSVNVFARNTAGGALTYGGCIGDSAGCAATSPPHALDGANSVVVSPDGNSAYVTGGGSINQFSRATQPPPPSVTCENLTQNITVLFPTKLTLKCSDSVSAPLEYKIVSKPAHGELGTIEPSGAVLYKPNSLISVSDSFTYDASLSSDPEDVSNTATVTLISPFSLTGRTFSSVTGLGGSLRGSGGTRPGLGSSSTLRPQTTSATFDNQRITLTTPSLLSCTKKSLRLAATLKSTAIKGSKAPKLRFSSAAFYIDKGIRHTHRKTIRTSSGHKKSVTVVTYSANATARHVPMTLALSLAGVKSGTHKLTVKLSYQETERKHGHKITVTVHKTLTAQFKVC